MSSNDHVAGSPSDASPRPADGEFRFSPRPNRADEIHWRPWGDELFKEAQTTGKPVLLSLSAVWCHWCHVMDETTYSDRRVIERINGRFIPTRVDNDRRPDVNRRYNMGGWPTTAFLTETGDVITGATYLPADQMLEALERVDETYAAKRTELVQRGASQRAATLSRLRAAARAEEQEHADAEPPETAADEDADATPPAGGSRAWLLDSRVMRREEFEWAERTVDEVRRQALAALDSEHGGFGTEQKFPQTETLAYLLLRTGTQLDRELDAGILLTLDSMASKEMYDRAEDGFFRYATQRDWTVPHYEKMLEDNARLLSVYVQAARIYGGRDDDDSRAAAQRFTDVARGVMRYLDDVLWQSEGSTYAGSQDADEHYYSLDLDARRALERTPFVDPTVYVDWNALAARALLQAATLLEDEAPAERALLVLDRLWDTAHGRRGMAHYLTLDDDALHVGPVDGMLGDQAATAAALLDAYEWTGSRAYLARAEVLADWVDEHLSAPGGSLFDRIRTLDTAGLLALPRVAMEECAAMADVWLRLGSYSGDVRWRRRAAKSLTSLSSLVDRYGIMAAPVASALLRFTQPRLHVTIVGAPDDGRTRSLHRTALAITSPQRTVQVLDPADDAERLVRDGLALDAEPHAYVCRGPDCLPPTADPEVLRESTESQSGADASSAPERASGDET